MKIAIIGTRGIPNNYGGFEQLAQHLSLGLKSKGHEVYVYCSGRHPYRKPAWEGIHLLHKFDPEKNVGTIGQFIYDFNCIVDSRKRKFDVILNLGYTSSSIWMKLFSDKTLVITNMDGLEWKRSKYNTLVRQFLRFAERLAVKESDLLVADSLAIQDYLSRKYKVQSTYIAYGAELFDNPDESVIRRFNVKAFGYNMLIARMEPENNIELILDGVTAVAGHKPFFVIGNADNKFGKYLVRKYRSDPGIIFTGPNYNVDIINNLRHYCDLYFHGHSVGGTNPSLLEAMGCHSLIAAHDNDFNRNILGKDAFYFKTAADISRLVGTESNFSAVRQEFAGHNYMKVKHAYSWTNIVQQYESVMLGS